MKKIILIFLFIPYFSVSEEILKSQSNTNKDIFIYCLKHSTNASDGVVFLDKFYVDCLSKAKDFEKYCGNNQKNCFQNLWWNARKKLKTESNNQNQKRVKSFDKK